jgi:N-acetylmuramoyl-L-alanine amidase
MPSIYISPSTQEYNEFVGGGNDEYYMNQIVDAMEPYLIACGIDFQRNNPENTLSKTISESNSGNYDLHLSLHSNASPETLSGLLQGADFYYFTRSMKGRDAASVLADNFMSIYPDPSKVKIMPTTGLAEVGRTRAPAVLAEIAYHDNPSDATWMTQNIDMIGKNLTQGLAEYFQKDFVDLFEDAQPQTGIVTTESTNLNIRARPSTSSEVLTQAPKGAELKVYSTAGLWYLVEYNGVLGFAYSKYITLA